MPSELTTTMLANPTTSLVPLSGLASTIRLYAAVYTLVARQQ